MASPVLYDNGIGGTSGGSLVTLEPVYSSGRFIYVDFTNGTDAASPAGRERVKPIKTLAQAITNASAYDTVVFLSGHAETLTAVQAISAAGLTLTSEGTGANRARFTRNITAGDELFDITGAGVCLENLFFVSGSIAATNGKVRIASDGCVVTGCYFEAGANDTGAQLEFVTGAADALVEDTTFISTATSLSAQPESAIKVTNAMTGLDLKEVTLSGGTVGWSNPYAFNGAAAVTRLRARNVDQLLTSSALMATGTTGYWIPRNVTGNSRVEWAA